MAKLNLRQRKFVDEYIISGNATEAAIAAGYSRKYAGQNADKLLKNTKIKNYLDERMQELEEQAIAKQSEVLKYLTSVMRGEEQEEVLIGEGMGEQSIGNMAVSAKDRIKAAELLGKRYGSWTDRQEVDLNASVTFVDDVPLDDDD